MLQRLKIGKRYLTPFAFLLLVLLLAGGLLFWLQVVSAQEENPLCQAASISGPTVEAGSPNDYIYRFQGRQSRDLGSEFFCRWTINGPGAELDYQSGVWGCTQSDITDLDFSRAFPADTEISADYTVCKTGTGPKQGVNFDCPSDSFQLCQVAWTITGGQSAQKVGEPSQPPIEPGTTTVTDGGQRSTGLVPCGGVDYPCTFCHFFALLDNILDFVTLRLTPILGALLFAVGALFVMTAGITANPAQVQTGYKIMLGVFLGAIIIFASWVIVDSFLTFLIDPSQFPVPWFKIECPIS